MARIFTFQFEWINVSFKSKISVKILASRGHKFFGNNLCDDGVAKPYSRAPCHTLGMIPNKCQFFSPNKGVENCNPPQEV
jgi:hypothetical protein